MFMRRLMVSSSRRCATLLGLIALSILLSLFGPVASQPVLAQSWTLSNAQRQAYLHYYAPIIMKRANADQGYHGRDWITNFDFDRDGVFSNNRANWLAIPQYINAAAAGPNSYYERWRIRPTLYTSLIEFMDGGSKNVILIYHVYHASDKDNKIHDWERIELLVRNVAGSPGSGEYVDWVTITRHHEHIVRRYYDSSMHFMQTATGRPSGRIAARPAPPTARSCAS
jgi:hypothetical protein